MKDEKEIGISKNHLEFIADEITSVIPSEWENIVLENDEGIKQLNYVKLSTISWGAVRELIEENKTMKSKIEHLEASMFEMMENIKELKGKKKPKAKAKAKE